MADTISTSVQLDIPQTPEILEPELFKEFVRVYNSLQLLAQKIDDVVAGIQLESPVSADATDLPSAIDLVNDLRSALIIAKIVV